MAILRAGPFATSADSFLNEPASYNASILPVNVANKNKTGRWPWQCAQRIKNASGTSEGYETYASDISITESVVVADGVPGVELLIKFYYQAANSWSFSGSSYEADCVDGESTDEPLAETTVSVNGSNVYTDSEEGVLSGGVIIAEISGNYDSIVFPASVVPALVEINLFAVAANTSDANLDFTLPIIDNT